MYNLFILNVGMHPGASEMPTADSRQMGGCTKVQPYKLLNSNQVNSELLQNPLNPLNPRLKNKCNA